MCPRGSRTLWAIHNAMMWVAWVLLMCVILCSARYFRHYWRKSIYIHAIFSGIVALLTVGGVIMAWKRNWDMSNKREMEMPGTYPYGPYIMHWQSYSAMFENIATFWTFGIFISGSLAWFYRRFGSYAWGTTRVLKMGKFHKYFSLVFCFFVQGLIMFAIIDNFGFT